MIERPFFAPWLRPEIAGGDGVFLVSERVQRLLTGRVARLIAPLIDGHRSVDEIVEIVAAEAPAAEVYYALMLLEQQGYLVEAGDGAASETAAFWLALDPGRPPSHVRRAEDGVSVVTFGGVSSVEFDTPLAGLGLRMTGDGGFLVALTDDYLQPGLEDLNASALEHGQAWLLCKPVGTVLWLGPLFRPGVTGCWECLAARLRDNRPLETYLQRRRGSATPIVAPQIALSASRQTGINLVAMEAARWLARGQSAVEGAIVTLDLATLTSERHTLVRRPQCPRCGEPEYRSPPPATPIVLQPRPNAPAEAPTTRPETTLGRYDHHVSRLTGLVAGLRRVSADDDPVAVYAALSNAARRSDADAFLEQGPRGPSGGRGLTDAQARAGALCEALERHSGRLQGYEPRRRASYAELGDAAIHPNACMLFSERQYREREAWNVRGSRFHLVPDPFEEEQELDWTPVWSLTHNAWRYLPAQYCFYDAPAERGRIISRADSNGCAAGNSLAEAILRGLFELVERDCVAVWWYNRLRRPAVDLDSFADPSIATLRRSYRSLGRQIWALDITNDLQVPAFVAASRRTSGAGEELILGFGAGLDARIALLRALMEMSQVLLPARRLDAMSEQERGALDPDLCRWLQTATLAEQPYLAPDEAAPPHAAPSYSAPGNGDALDGIERCRRAVERLGIEVLAIDQTRPDVGLPVARVIAPGLRHFWPRFAPGRLYDVPVKLGWLHEPLSEENLNPIPLFL